MRLMEITFKGSASEVLRAEFAEVARTVTATRGITRLLVAVGDSSVLHGILAHIDALGLELLDAHRVDDVHPATGEAPSPT